MFDHAISGKNLQRLVEKIWRDGAEIKSERGLTREVLNLSLVLRNPLDRVDTTLWRKMNIAFATAEFLGYLNGEDNLSYFTPFIADYGRYSRDGTLVDGAYGPRITDLTSRTNRLEEAITLLVKNPVSRRAVVPIYNVTDIDPGSKGSVNTPCTLSMQFLIRDGKCIMVTNMRSNDVHYGLTNDLFAFTMIHEYVADRLMVGLGPYFHNAASMHVYADQYDKFKARINPDEARWPYFMEPMEGALTQPAELPNLYLAYKNILDTEKWAEYNTMLRTRYARNLSALGRAYVLRKDNPSEARRWYSLITDQTLKRVLRPWLAIS